MGTPNMDSLWKTQFKALLKRNYLLKRRYMSTTVWEYVIPIAQVIIFGAIQIGINNATKTPVTMFPSQEVGANGTTNFLFGELLIVPDTPDTRQIAQAVCNRTGCTFQFFSDESAAESYYKATKAPSMGISFEPSMTSYSIRYPAEAAIPDYVLSSNAGDCSYGTCPASSFLTSGIVTLQSIVDAEIIKLQSSSASFVSTSLSAQLMPEFRDVIIRNDTLRIMFPIYFVYAMSYLVMYMCFAVVDDKVKKRKDHLTMMGVRSFPYWAAWAVINLPNALIISVISVIVLAGFQFFTTSGAFAFFFFAVLFYCLNNILIAITWSCILQKTELIFLTMLGTVAIGAVGFVNVYLTDYTSDLSYPKSSIAPLGGIICLLPPACMVSILERMYSMNSRYPGGLVTSAFFAGDLPLIAMIIILIFDIFLWTVLAMWLEGVLPNSLGARLPLCFCFDKKYWSPDPADLSAIRGREQASTVDDCADVEPVARSLNGKESVRLFDIKKEFLQKNGMFGGEVIKAVQGVNLDIYEGQITALLGHNGAGKTTLINMMTGIMPVTSGSATLYGYDVTNGVDLQSIRQMMGICQQENVISERLTVREHLELYGRIKGVPESELIQKIEATIADVDLTDQADVHAQKLSGGQKRKLNVGMALIGDPKILFLDEPTAGMDPYSRRHLWNLLKKSRDGRVILLTTHFMDEADILADRKAVISKGKLQCAGSSLYLKNKFGIGYHLTLLVNNTDVQGELTTLIGQIIEGSAHKRTFGKEITYSLPIQQSTNFAELFANLDSRKEDLQLSSYSVAMTSLEEVFLKLGEQSEEEERLEKEKTALRRGSKVDQEAVSLTIQTEHNIDLINPNDLERESKVNTDWLRFSYMLKLRLKMIPRERFILVALVVYAIFTAVGVVLLATSQPGFTVPPSPTLRTLDMYDSLFSQSVEKPENYHTNTILYHNYTQGDIDSLLSPVAATIGKNMSLDDGEYSPTQRPSPFGYDVQEFTTVLSPSNITVRYNHTYTWSLPLAVNVFGTSVLQLFTKDSTAKIETSIYAWPSYAPLVYTFNSGTFAGLAFVMALHIGASMFAVTIVQEKERKLRPLLRTAGVTVNTYFGVFILVCFILLSPVLIASVVAILACQIPAYSVAGAAVLLIIHIFIQLFVTILLTFCWSYAFDRAQSAGNIVSINMWLSILIFSAMPVLINIPQTVKVAKTLHHVLCFLVPVYAFPGGLLMIEETYRSYVVASNNVNAVPPSVVYFYPENGVISAILGGIFWTGLLFVFLRLGEVKQNGGKTSDLFKCFSNSLSLYDPSAKNTDSLPDEDTDIVDERTEVDQLLQQAAVLPKDVIMVGSNLRKQFSRKKKPDKVAVRNVTFHVAEGEVFGLLGPNGAGKTTVLNMIIAEHAPTAGQVIVDNIEVHSALSEAFNIIGFCPQADALWEAITVTELMVFFGISSGFTEAQAKAVAEYYIKMLQIEEHKDKFSKNLSGGSRRKVSFALALMGWPRLVLLDEPSTGLDPSSKRFLWDTIRASFNEHGRSAILTTHYMEEADALCNRIGIMVNGALECLGTSQHLKNKYGDGYQLEIKLKDSNNSQQNMNRLKEFVESSFSQCTIIEEFSDRIQYAVPTTSITSPSDVFGPLEQNKEALEIEEYSFSQSTLEQVFIQFAKQQLEADEDEGNANKSRQQSKNILRQRSISGVSNKAASTNL